MAYFPLKALDNGQWDVLNRQDPNSLPVSWIGAVPLRELLKTFLRLFIGFSVIDVIWTPPMEKWNLSVTFPFFTTRDQDLVGLYPIRAHLMRRSKHWRICLQPGTDAVVTVRLYINALMGAATHLTWWMDLC